MSKNGEAKQTKAQQLLSAQLNTLEAVEEVMMLIGKVGRGEWNSEVAMEHKALSNKISALCDEVRSELGLPTEKEVSSGE
jgi:hypothetical protein